VNTRISRRIRCLSRTPRGQAMTEFILAAFVAAIVLFVAIQFAVLGRESMALGQLDYQVTRWATDSANNTLANTNSPQCSDVANLISGTPTTPPSPYEAEPAMASGYMGKIGYGSGRTVCGAPPKGGIGVAMTCLQADSKGAINTATSCAAQRAAGTAVQITLTMDTSWVLLFNTGSSGSPSFFGIPFPATLSSTHTMLTQ